MRIHHSRNARARGCRGAGAPLPPLPARPARAGAGSRDRAAGRSCAARTFFDVGGETSRSCGSAPAGVRFSTGELVTADLLGCIREGVERRHDPALVGDSRAMVCGREAECHRGRHDRSNGNESDSQFHPARYPSQRVLGSARGRVAAGVGPRQGRDPHHTGSDCSCSASWRGSRTTSLPKRLLERLREQGARIGLATVYRTLALLAERGVIDTLAHHTGELCYRLCGDTHHHHLMCSNAIRSWSSETVTSRGGSPRCRSTRLHRNEAPGRDRRRLPRLPRRYCRPVSQQKTPPERGFRVSRRPDSNRGPLHYE